MASRPTLRVEPVYVLVRVDVLEDGLLVDVLGQRELDDHPIDALVQEEGIEALQQPHLRDLLRKLDKVKVDPDVRGGLALAVHIKHGVRPIAHEDHREARRPVALFSQVGDILRDFGQPLLRYAASVQDRRRGATARRAAVAGALATPSPAGRAPNPRPRGSYAPGRLEAASSARDGLGPHPPVSRNPLAVRRWRSQEDAHPGPLTPLTPDRGSPTTDPRTAVLRPRPSIGQKLAAATPSRQTCVKLLLLFRTPTARPHPE